MAKYLDISMRKWNKIHFSNGTTTFIYKGISGLVGYQFEQKEDAQKVIEILEPYLIMKELIGDGI